MNCSICDREIQPENGWREGHNADPINEGRCCTPCNDNVVIPERLRKTLNLCYSSPNRRPPRDWTKRAVR